VTCEKDVGQWENKYVSGHLDFNALGFFGSKRLPNLNGCGDLQLDCNNWEDKRSHRIVATHNSLKVNLHDSYQRHRCYLASDQCICECLDIPAYSDTDKAGTVFTDRHQEGTVQGNAGGVAGHRGRMEEQSIFSTLDSSFVLPEDGTPYDEYPYQGQDIFNLNGGLKATPYPTPAP
jgi:hypothetical protein